LSTLKSQLRVDSHAVPADPRYCVLGALPVGFGAMVGLRMLDLSWNKGLAPPPEGLWSLAGLEELSLQHCGLAAVSGGVGALDGLRVLDLHGNEGLAALPAGLG
jgi:hypothetical protein